MHQLALMQIPAQPSWETVYNLCFLLFLFLFSLRFSPVVYVPLEQFLQTSRIVSRQRTIYSLCPLSKCHLPLILPQILFSELLRLFFKFGYSICSFIEDLYSKQVLPCVKIRIFYTTPLSFQ